MNFHCLERNAPLGKPEKIFSQWGFSPWFKTAAEYFTHTRFSLILPIKYWAILFWYLFFFRDDTKRQLTRVPPKKISKFEPKFLSEQSNQKKNLERTKEFWVLQKRNEDASSLEIQNYFSKIKMNGRIFWSWLIFETQFRSRKWSSKNLFEKPTLGFRFEMGL